MSQRITRSAAFATASLLFFLQVPEAAFGQPQGYEGFKVVRIQTPDASNLEKLRKLETRPREFQIWSERPERDHFVDARVSPQLLSELDAAGFDYDVLVPDLQEQLNSLYNPAVAGAGFFDAYRTNEEHAAFLQDLAAQYPDLASVAQIGASVLNRPLSMIRISGSPTAKPAVLYIGAQHGNEMTNPAVLAFLAQYLLNNYGADARITTLVDEMEWFILPIANPDGYDTVDRYNAHGADLNRNWQTPNATSYFNQPETRAIRDFLLANFQVHAFIDFHTYGRMILWSWGYKGMIPPNNATLRHLSDDLAERIRQVRGTTYPNRGPAYTTLYPARGLSIDYAYGSLGIWSYTIEVGWSYAAPVADLIPISQELLPAMLRFAEWSLDCDDNGIDNSTEIALGSEDCNANQTPDSCEADLDADGIVDGCDDDWDNDGVLNNVDACPLNTPGIPVQATGRPTGETGQNCVVDIGDWKYLVSSCGFGHAIGPDRGVPSACALYADSDADGDIDLVDISHIQIAFGR